MSEIDRLARIAAGAIRFLAERATFARNGRAPEPILTGTGDCRGVCAIGQRATIHHQNAARADMAMIHIQPLGLTPW
jgi:hypothetical protein